MTKKRLQLETDQESNSSQGTVNQKDIAILNSCAPNPGALNLIKNVLVGGLERWFSG